MLIKQCRELDNKLAQFEILDKSGTDSAMFDSIEEQLDEWLNLLRPLYTTLEIFKSKGIEITDPPSANAYKLQEKLSEINSIYKENPQYLTKRNVLQEDIKHFIPPLATGMQDVLDNAWKHYTNKYVSGMIAIPLHVLEKIPILRPKLTTIRTLKEQLRRLSDTLPETEEDIENFHKSLNELKQQLSTLSGADSSEDLPPSVVNFLEALGKDSASLNLLTKEVLTWISRLNLEEYFRVVIRPTQ